MDISILACRIWSRSLPTADMKAGLDKLLSFRRPWDSYSLTRRVVLHGRTLQSVKVHLSLSVKK